VRALRNVLPWTLAALLGLVLVVLLVRRRDRRPDSADQPRSLALASRANPRTRELIERLAQQRRATSQTAAAEGPTATSEEAVLTEEEEALRRSELRAAVYERFRSQLRDADWANETEPVIREVVEAVTTSRHMDVTIGSVECRSWECVAEATYDDPITMRKMEDASFEVARIFRQRGMGEVHPGARGYGAETDVPRQRLYFRFPDRRQALASSESTEAQETVP
jgi:hypothetical protein